MAFNVVSGFKVSPHQAKAVESLSQGIKDGEKLQTLLGVTGSGKTFVMAKVIEKINKPTLILTHNKTLAAQLYSEFKEFFPNNAVEYFVSYYDYYQPEAYVVSSDLYIEKDASINDEIDRLRLKATASLMEREDVIIVSSVSCIYGLGDPDEFTRFRMEFHVGEEFSRDDLLRNLVSIYYERNDISFIRGTFRVRGDVVEIFPAYAHQEAIRVELFGDEIESISKINPLTGNVIEKMDDAYIYPAKHFVAPEEENKVTVKLIEQELKWRLEELRKDGKLVEAQRLESRTKYDIEMILEVGYCSGIENYSRIITRKKPGERPSCLLDYFKGNYLMFVDESHVTLPQVRGMYKGDRARKENLVNYGFRLPSALDNRPLVFEEFEEILDQALFVSATPADYEIEKSSQVVEQVIRPTGLLDPKITVRPAKNQVDDLVGEVNKRAEINERVLVTTLTKKMAEDLAKYFDEIGIKSRYLHSEINTFERVEIIRDLRKGDFDCLIGINLLREGLDIPEVSLVAILDADKEGFLRSTRSLVQTSGRAARNVNGSVIFYADKVTNSMQVAMDETSRRREIQKEYNRENNITPESIKKDVVDIIKREYEHDNSVASSVADYKSEYNTRNESEAEKLIKRLKEDMLKAAEDLEFEKAAILRDEMTKLKKKLELKRKVKG